MLKSNGFANDTDGERLERVLLLSANIDTHEVQLEIGGDKLVRCGWLLKRRANCI